MLKITARQVGATLRFAMGICYLCLGVYIGGGSSPYVDIVVAGIFAISLLATSTTAGMAVAERALKLYGKFIT